MIFCFVCVLSSGCPDPDLKFLLEKIFFGLQILISYYYNNNSRNLEIGIYLLYETGIIGSVGVTLGLFIGFSFHDIIGFIIDKLRTCAINNQNNPMH